jgi:hypothetical protein
MFNFPSPRTYAGASRSWFRQRCYQILEGQSKQTGGESVLPDGYTAVDAHFEPLSRRTLMWN